MAQRLYLDTNIFILTFEKNDETARRLLNLISLNESSKSHFLFTSELTVAELMVDPIRKNDDRLVAVYDNLTIGNAFVGIGSVSREVLWSAAMLRAKYASLRLPDAIHLSTAMHLGCDRFLTADKRLKEEIYFVTPRTDAPVVDIGQVSIVRPEILELDRITRELTT